MSPEPDQRAVAARRTELGASGVAGTVGVGFGAAKLRDAYRDDLGRKALGRHASAADATEHGDKIFDEKVKRAQARARSRGVSAKTAERVGDAVRTWKPPFKALLVATGAGAVATGASRYGDHRARITQRGTVKKDAFGVDRWDLVEKSQMPDGSYRPASSLSPDDRVRVKGMASLNRMTGLGRQQALSVQDRRRYVNPNLSENSRPGGGHRGTNELYGRHGFGAAESGAHTLIHAKSTQSSVHPNIHYGASIPAEHHADLDRRIDPKQAANLRHPVTIHHDAMPHGIAAAAVGSHVTTRHRGHVVLNSAHMSPGGKLHPGQPEFGSAKGRHVLAHELEHASLKHSNPIKWMHHDDNEMSRRSLGEEGRADARSQKGKGLYQRTGAVVGEKDVRRAARATPKKIKRSMAKEGMSPADMKKFGLNPKQLASQAREGSKIMGHYHQVRNVVRAARVAKSDTVSAFGIEHGYALGDVSKAAWHPPTRALGYPGVDRRKAATKATQRWEKKLKDDAAAEARVRARQDGGTLRPVQRPE